MMKVTSALLLGLLTIVIVFGKDNDKDHKGYGIIKVHDNKYASSPRMLLETELDSFNLQFAANKGGM